MTGVCDTLGQVSVAEALTEILSSVLGVAEVAPDDHFFDDLGADSMVMARFCARVRKREGLPAVSMRDIYRHSTIADLAEALAPATPTPADEPGSMAAEVRADRPAEEGIVWVTPTGVEVTGSPGSDSVGAGPGAPAGTVVRRAGPTAYVLCGALQLLAFVGYSTLTLLILVRGYEWVAAGAGVVDFYQRALAVGVGFFLLTVTLPILLKWVLIGRWRPQEIPVWSLAYVRFWVVKTAIRVNPLALFVGSPLYVLYLRALGAKIGRGAVILTRNMPVCTDLLTVGAGTVIRKDAFLACYRAHDGVIQTGPVTLGSNAFVGDFAVLDIETSMGEGAELGHASSLHSGQAVPAHERWHGSPARPTTTSYRLAAATAHGTWRRFTYGALQLAGTVFVALPLLFGFIDVLLMTSVLAPLLDPAIEHATNALWYAEAAILSAVFFFGLLGVALLVVTTLPRLLALALPPGRVWPMYGLRYTAHRTVERMTNLTVLAFLFGDSSFIVHYLRGIGYHLKPVEQTGSNFGQRVKHENPFLSAVGTGTMVADGLSFLNADYSSTAFRLSRAAIGARSFLGNNVVYPAGARTGDNVLLATKVMVPIEGPIREGVGLLGSPSFEIPRSVHRDTALVLADRLELRRRLRAKNIHNLITMALYLAVRWAFLFAVIVFSGLAFDAYHAFGAWTLPMVNMALLVLTVAYWVAVERSVLSLAALVPHGCSIYERAFFRHERFWKVPAQAYVLLFNGTPVKGLIWRLLGVRIGKRVFDDGCGLVEKDFVSIGDECTLNAGSIIQCHSQEDGAFKSDRSAVGARSTLGVAAFVHYGVSIGEGAVLAPDSFLMKGEEVPPGASWGGNPARDLADEPAAFRPAPVTTGELR